MLFWQGKVLFLFGSFELLFEEASKVRFWVNEIQWLVCYVMFDFEEWMKEKKTKAKVQFNESSWLSFFEMPKQDQWGFFDEWVSIGFVLPKCCLSMTENVFDSCHKPGQVMSLGVFWIGLEEVQEEVFFWRWMRGWFMWWLGWLQMVFHDRKVRLGYSQARPMQFCERESILLICVCYVGLCVCYDRKCWDNLSQAKPAFVLLLLDAASKFWKNGQSAVF